MTVPGGYVAGDVLTAANMNLLPAGYIGHAATSTSQTGISSTATDLTSLSVSLTAVANRRYRIAGLVNFRQRTAAGLVTVEIAVGTTVKNSSHFSMVTADDYGSLYVFWQEVPGAGAITYKLRAKTSGGTVDINPLGASTHVSWITVEDIGT